VRGQELVEYALLAGFIVVSVAAFVPYTVSAPISSVFSKVQTYLSAWGNG
jgi:Flp pilus assembly pilin Flp